MEKIIIKASIVKRIFWLSIFGFAAGGAVMLMFYTDKSTNLFAILGVICVAVGFGAVFFVKLVTFNKEILTIESTGFTNRNYYGFEHGFISWSDVRTITLKESRYRGMRMKYIQVMVSNEEVLLKSIPLHKKKILKIFIRLRGAFVTIKTAEAHEKAEKIFNIMEQYYYRYHMNRDT